MTHLLILALLAGPASAATITEVALDHGDDGVCVTDLGFRPCTGPDTYAGKINPCHPMYDGLHERRVYLRCGLPLPADLMAQYVAPWGVRPTTGGMGASVALDAPVTPLVWPLPVIVGRDTGPTTEPWVPVAPEPSPVPLPATVWLLAAALLMLRRRHP